MTDTRPNASGELRTGTDIAPEGNVAPRKKTQENAIPSPADAATIRNYCSHAISRSGNEDELFADICAIIARHHRIRMAFTGLADPHENLIHFVRKSEEYIDFPEKISLSTKAGHPDGESIAVLSFSTDKPFWNRDFRGDPVSAWWPEQAANEIPLRSLAALPLHENGKTIGVFLLASDIPDAFDSGLRRLLTEIADDMDFAIANFRREQIRMKAEHELRRLYVESRVTESEIRRLNQLYTTLDYCNQAIVRCTTQNELFGEICRIAIQYDTIDIAWIGIMERAQRLIPVAMEGASPETIAEICEKMTPHIIGQAIRDDKPVWIQDCESDPACDCDALMRMQCRRYLADTQPICAIACLPLHKGGEIAGMLVLHAFRAGAFDIVVQKLLKELTDGIDLALDNYVRDEKLQLSADMFTQSNEGMMLLDSACRIVMVNQAFTRITGYDRAEVMGRNPRILSSGRHDRAFYDAMWDDIREKGCWQGEIWNTRKNGAGYPEWLSIQAMYDPSGKLTHYIGLFSDMTERKKAQDRIQWLAHFDALTGLPNRTLLHDRCRQAISLAQRSRKPLALIFLDLDGFKQVNDTLGHKAGDELLRLFAARLKGVVRDQDTVSRQGGDEFVLVLPDTDTDGAANIAGKLLAAASEPCRIGEQELNLSASIGIAMYPDDGMDFETLSCCADTAMYRVKQNGRAHFRFFTTEMQAGSTRMHLIGSALPAALENDSFSLLYQPILSLESHTVTGFEAVLRWEHPELGTIAPDEFLRIAESNGQIMAICQWMLRRAIGQLRAWHEAGKDAVTVSVNLSAIPFHDRNLPQRIARWLREAGVPPEKLVLEIPETVVMEKPHDAIAAMDAFRAAGMKVAIDRFGTGYSSIAILKRLGAYSLKIDSSCVSGVTDNEEAATIARAMIALAAALGIRTVAEGVETAGQMRFFGQAGCDAIQGNFFAGALDERAASDFIERNHP